MSALPLARSAPAASSGEAQDAMHHAHENTALLARSVHPEYRQVIATYAKYQGLPLAEIGFGANGRRERPRVRRNQYRSRDADVAGFK